MSWLRNGQVSLVALAVSAAIGLAGCGGAESDREGGTSTKVTDAPKVSLLRAISEDAPGAGYSLPRFNAIAGDDGILTVTEANAALVAAYKQIEWDKYVAANTPKEKSLDADGDGVLTGLELTNYNSAVAQATKDADLLIANITSNMVPQFADSESFIALFDSATDKNNAALDSVIKAIDFGIRPPADVTGIALDPLKGSLSDLYVRGTITTWDGGAALVDTNKFVKTGDSTYEYDYTSPVEGYGEFKIADGTWAASTNCGTSAEVLIRGVETADATAAGYVGACGPTSPNVRVYFYKNTNYRFKVDFADAANPLFWVTKNSGSAGSVIPPAVTALKTTVKDAASFNAAAGVDQMVSYTEAKAVSPDLTSAQFLELDKNLDLQLSAAELNITLIPPVSVDCGTEVTTDANNVYLVGGFTKVAGSAWKFGDKCKLTKSGTKYSIGLDLPGNPNEAVEFKFANAGWSPINCAAVPANVSVTLATPLTGSCAGDAANLKVVIPEAGYYKFDFDVADSANPVITVAKSTKPVAGGDKLPEGVQLYVRGNVTDASWNAVDAGKLAWSDAIGGYTVTVANVAAGSSEFKVADSAWGADCGAKTAAEPVAVGGALVGQCVIAGKGTKGENMALTIPEKGNYAFNVIFKAVDGVYTPTFQVVKK